MENDFPIFQVNDQQMGSEMHVPTEPKLEEQRMDASGLDPTTGKHARLGK